jgi:thiamine-phosphate pyrophosphorylase
MLRCAVTSGDGWAAMAHAQRWASEGVEFVQLREKQLGAAELVRLAAAMRTALRETGKTKLLVNGRADVAVAAGADGMHLTARARELTAEQVRRVFRAAGAEEPVVSVSCHSLEEVRRAVDGGMDLILFGPVFEKRVVHPGAGEVVVAGVGLEALRAACAAAGTTPVLALGGVTWESAGLCVEAGAAGVAGIRLFG